MDVCSITFSVPGGAHLPGAWCPGRGERAAANVLARDECRSSCDRGCLIGLARGYMTYGRYTRGGGWRREVREVEERIEGGRAGGDG